MDIIFLTILGLIFGSFLNVLIYRLPLNISIIKPLISTCPVCNHQIKWYENIPVISYLLLKGKCSNCNNNISIIYPLVEIITAITTVLIYYKNLYIIDFTFIISIFYILIVLSFIDLKYKEVPGYLLIIILIPVIFVGNIIDMLIFTGGAYLLNILITFYIQNIKAKLTNNKDLKTQIAMGEADIPIIGVMGGLLGLKLGFVAMVIAAISALLFAIYNLFIKQEIETPFIPFLTLGLFITYISF
jgi:leader peptidase (prepilin peptidase)/N-methyltransferase